MEDWQALTSKEKDSHFSNVILATFSRQLLLAISPFVLLFLYTILSIIIKGDTKEGYFTAKQLLFMSVLSVFIVIGYLKASNSHFEDLIGLKLSLSRKKAFYSLAEGMLLVLMYLVVIFYLYIIISIGLFPLWTLHDEFSIFKVFKFITFTSLGFFGIKAVIHILIIIKYSHQGKQHLHSEHARGILQYRILGYIYKYRLVK